MNGSPILHAHRLACAGEKEKHIDTWQIAVLRPKQEWRNLLAGPVFQCTIMGYPKFEVVSTLSVPSSSPSHSPGPSLISLALYP